MTEHAIGTHAVATKKAPIRKETPRAESEPRAEESVRPESGETLAAASMFIIPTVTFILIVTMWYSVGGF